MDGKRKTYHTIGDGFHMDMGVEIVALTEEVCPSSADGPGEYLRRKE